MVAEHALATSKMSNWIVDSGATCHICNDEEAFDHISVLDIAQVIMVGDGYSVRAIGKGNMILDMYLPNGKIKRCRLTDVLLVKDLSYNLLSVSKAATTGIKFEFEQSSCKIADDKHGVIATATKYGNLYYLSCVGSIEDNKEDQAAMKCANKSDETKESIWHRRYGHLGARNLERIAKEQLVDGFDYDPENKSSFVNHVLMVSSVECYFQRQEEKDLRSYLVLYTVTFVERLKRSHSTEQNILLLSSMTSQDLSRYTH